MNIVMEKEVNDRLQDGIHTILNFNEEDFNKLISMFTIENGKKIEDFIYLFYSTDEHKNTNIDIQLGVNEKNERGYVGGVSYPIKDFISKLETYIQNIDKSSNEYMRCKKIVETRSLEAFKRIFSGPNGEKSGIVDKLFEVLTNSNELENFMDFNSNTDHFAVNGEQQDISEYLKIFGNIFRYKDDSEGEEYTFFPGMALLITQFNIPETLIESIKKNATKLYDQYHGEYTRYIDKRYEFKALDGEDDYKVFRKNDEPDWNVNKELREAVYKDMPQDLSLEEKALYIYTKLCKELEYNEEYLYKDKGISSQFKSDFSKEKLESIKSGTKVTCFDFSRIFSKLVNELDGDIEAVIISQGENRGHFLTGFYTDKVSVRLEAINIKLNGKNDPTNDLMKAKNGIKLRGIQPIFDNEEIVQNALDKVYSLIYGRKALSIKRFVQELKSMPIEEIPNDINLKLQSFIEVMKEKRVTGNEFVQTLDGMCLSKFFGQNIEKAYIGKRFEKEGEKHIQRMILFREKGEDENTDPHLYLIDTSSLEMVQPTPQQLIDQINSGEMVYESDKHKIPGIDKEVKDDTTK